MVTVPTNIFFKKISGVKRGKIRVINSPLRREQFKLKYQEEKTDIKNKYGYQNKKVIFFYGSMHSQKGADILIKTIPLVIKEFHNSHFIYAKLHLYAVL